MATSTSYFGLRRGSTKSHTFSVVDGKQITKDRVEGGKNPRTLPQMTQRCLLSTAGAAYSAMKSICDHSFEGKPAGKACMVEFMSANMKQIQISKEYDNGFFGFNKYQQPGLVPGSYIISEGSLPKALVDAEIGSINVANKKVTVNMATTAGGSIAEVAEAMGCKNYGDICTIAVMFPKSDGTYGFGAVRFTYMSGATVLESFAIAVTGDATSAALSFTSNTLKVEIRLLSELAAGATTANTYMAAISSRHVNGNWLRSRAQFNVTSATPTFTEAISTYPVGLERFLNGKEVLQPAPTATTNGGSSTNGGGDSNTGGNTGSTSGDNTGGNSGNNNGGGNGNDGEDPEN